MPPSFDVYFASSNKNKYLEAEKILSEFGIRLGFFRCNLMEVQSDKLEDIAIQKIKHAFLLCKKPVIIEDDGLYIDSLHGFPGPYSSYVFNTIGNKGILKLLQSKRKASFYSVIAYSDSKNKPVLFRGKVGGKIAKKSSGTGWGYDPIFVPDKNSKTFAQISDKNKVSHRYVALKKFARWFDR